MTASLQRHPFVATAARVAATFRLDPVAVLAESDEFCWRVRIAAHNVVMADERKAAKKKGR